MKVCDYLIYLENGEIKYYGTPRRIPKLKNYEKAVEALFSDQELIDELYTNTK